MATASSSARRNADTNSGTSSGSSALARWKRLPVSKSAPRAFCADMILSVSSMSVGMKRRAMDIIMLISCTGTLSFLSGPKRISIASVSAMGDVVYVSRNVPAMSIVIRRTMNTARIRPSQVMVIFQKDTSSRPGVKKILSTAVSAMMIHSGLRPRRMTFSGMRESAMHTPVMISMTA